MADRGVLRSTVSSVCITEHCLPKVIARWLCVADVADVHGLTSYIRLVPWHVAIQSVVLFQTMSSEGWQLHCTLLLVQYFCVQLQQGGEVDDHSIYMGAGLWVNAQSLERAPPSPLFLQGTPPIGIPS